jgi:hypothetical protein
MARSKVLARLPDPHGEPPTPAAGDAVPSAAAGRFPPLLIDITGLSALLTRSVPSLGRDDAAGRLPAALRVGGSKRWRYADITLWVEWGCPARAQFEARRGTRN